MRTKHDMDDMNIVSEPLENEKQEELRRLCCLYTGKNFTLMNALLRGKLMPIFDDDRLERKMDICNRKLKDAEKYLKIYEPHGYGNSYIVPLDIYRKVEDACHTFAKLIKDEKEESGTFWRNVGVRGIKTTINDEYRKKAETYLTSDEYVKEKVKDSRDTFISEINNDLKGAVLTEKGFMSTSMDSNLNFNMDKRSIVLKIVGNKIRGLVVKFSNHEHEKEFLLPPNTKLKIDGISKCENNYLAEKAIQINCTVV